MYLPYEDDWFFVFTDELMPKSLNSKRYILERDESGIFIKAGSIIPRKQYKRMSSLQTMKDPFHIEIYLHPETKNASG